MSMISIKNNAKKNGFTLLEVLIALAITGFIITASYGTFFLSKKAIESIDDSLIRLQETRSVIDNLKRDIESSFFSRDSEYSAFKLEDRDFYGRSASRITFTAFSPLTTGLARISYNVDESDGRLTLKKTINSAFSLKTKAKDVELIDDIHSFLIEVKYGGKWVRTWDSKTTASSPEEVRITITFLEKGSGKKQAHETASVFDIARPMIRKDAVL